VESQGQTNKTFHLLHDVFTICIYTLLNHSSKHCKIRRNKTRVLPWIKTAVSFLATITRIKYRYWQLSI